MGVQIKKILIAEDERALSKALSLKLRKMGVEVINAFDGEEALRLLEQDVFDYILLDLMMPKKDGFQVLEELKKRGINTPITVLSNLGQEEDIQRAKTLGAKSYLVKANTPIIDIVEFLKKEAGI